MPRRAIAGRVAELLELVGLAEAGPKFPAQLSGGQQQRVALARALATSPGLLLLDEPLSALDARVRVRLRHEIRSLQRRLGLTTIMVTHDQEEALSMADRIVVMNQGVVEQVGTPLEIYRRPATPFVADFVGAMNFLDGVIAGPGRVRVAGAELAYDASAGYAPGTAVGVCVRPEDVAVRNLGPVTPNRLAAQVTTLDFLGPFCRATLSLGESDRIVADFSSNLVRDLAVAEGQPLDVALPPERLQLFLK
jgi:iron(III) transport system ATP-binding protein